MKVRISENTSGEVDLRAFEKLSVKDKQKVLKFIKKNIENTYSHYWHYKSLPKIESDQTLCFSDGENTTDYDGGFKSFFCTACEDFFTDDIKLMLEHVMKEHLEMPVDAENS